jgi:hypothetical protein
MFDMYRTERAVDYHRTIFICATASEFVPAKKIKLHANRKETIGSCRPWSSREITYWIPTMQDRVHIDDVHARAICNEIGERLRQALSRDETELPASLESRLNRLREQDDRYSPLIVPDLD